MTADETPAPPRFKVEPLEDRILVCRDKVADTTEGGIILSEGAKEKPLKGTVVAVGPGRWIDGGVFVPPTVQIGERVLFSQYGGTDVPKDKELGLVDDHLLMREGDLLGRIVESGSGEYPAPPET